MRNFNKFGIYLLFINLIAAVSTLKSRCQFSPLDVSTDKQSKCYEEKSFFALAQVAFMIGFQSSVIDVNSKCFVACNEICRINRDQVGRKTQF